MTPPGAGLMARAGKKRKRGGRWWPHRAPADPTRSQRHSLTLTFMYSPPRSTASRGPAAAAGGSASASAASASARAARCIGGRGGEVAGEGGRLLEEETRAAEGGPRRERERRERGVREEREETKKRKPRFGVAATTSVAAGGVVGASFTLRLLPQAWPRCLRQAHARQTGLPRELGKLLPCVATAQIPSQLPLVAPPAPSVCCALSPRVYSDAFGDETETKKEKIKGRRQARNSLWPGIEPGSPAF